MASEKKVLAKKKDIKTVYGTGKGRLVKGKAYVVHSLVAAKLVKLGVANAKAEAKTDEK